MLHTPTQADRTATLADLFGKAHDAYQSIADEISRREIEHGDLIASCLKTEAAELQGSCVNLKESVTCPRVDAPLFVQHMTGSTRATIERADDFLSQCKETPAAFILATAAEYAQSALADALALLVTADDESKGGAI